MSDLQENFYKKEIYLPYGQKLIQIFAIENETIKMAICFNEFLNKSFLVDGLQNFKLIVSDEIIPITKQEFSKFEAYI